MMVLEDKIDKEHGFYLVVILLFGMALYDKLQGAFTTFEYFSIILFIGIFGGIGNIIFKLKEIKNEADFL